MKKDALFIIFILVGSIFLLTFISTSWSDENSKVYQPNIIEKNNIPKDLEDFEEPQVPYEEYEYAHENESENDNDYNNTAEPINDSDKMENEFIEKANNEPNEPYNEYEYAHETEDKQKNPDDNELKPEPEENAGDADDWNAELEEAKSKNKNDIN